MHPTPGTAAAHGEAARGIWAFVTCGLWGQGRKSITEAAKLTWKWCAHTKGEEDPEAAWEGPSPGKDRSWEAFLEGDH